MIRSELAALCVAAVAAWTAVPDANAAQLTSVDVSEAASLPLMRPRWPVPDDTNQQFFIQRSNNRNTIVYVARFREDGILDPRRPIGTYWRRYAERGQRKPLKLIEGPLYGVNSRATAREGEYAVWLRNLPELRFVVRQTAPGRAETFATIGGKLAHPIYAFARVDQSGVFDRITEISLHGRLLDGGGTISETFRVSGGAIRP